jgi:hypothetical protein
VNEQGYSRWHADDGQCHHGCWYRATHPHTWEFDREAYIALADEFDPMGTSLFSLSPAPRLDDFDPDYIAAAERIASGLGIPVPWRLFSLDTALVLLGRREREEMR